MKKNKKKTPGSTRKFRAEGPPACRYCSTESTTVLAHFFEDSRMVYHGRDYGPIWMCVTCGAYCGCHKGTKLAMGSPANAELRGLRREAHGMFDAIWQERARRRIAEVGESYRPVYSRGKAYRWLAEQMGLTQDECHIGMLNEDQVRQVKAIVQPHFLRLRLVETRK